MNQKLHRQRSPGHLKKNIAQYKCMGLKSLSAYQSNTMGMEGIHVKLQTANSIIITILMAKLLNRMKSGEREYVQQYIE